MDIISFNPFLYQSESIYKVNISIPTIENVFPYKLNDLHGYSYQVLIYNQPPRLIKVGSIIYGIDIYFFIIIAEQQNANIQYRVLSSVQENFNELFLYTMQNSIVDLTLNTATDFTIDNQYFADVNTYDENGYCAMVPNPPRTSFLELILTPFDSSTWICMIVSIATCCLLWALFNCLGTGNSNSAGYFMFGVIANFIGQSIPFRSNRIIQVIIWQICIFMTFILGNAYQSLVISLMSESRNGTRLRSFDDLFASNFSSIVDPIFYNFMNSSGDHPWFTKNMMPASSVFDEMNFEMLSLNNTALIMRCDGANAFFYEKRFQKLNTNVNEFFYLLPDKMHPFYEKFQVSKNCPFEKFLKHKTLQVFESGIRQYWKSILQYKNTNVDENYIINEKYLLNMEDLYGVFYILIFGLILASITLTIEIFVHDCISNINFSKTYEAFQLFFFRLSEKKVDKMQVKRIQVIPAASVTEAEDQV